MSNTKSAADGAVNLDTLFRSPATLYREGIEVQSHPSQAAHQIAIELPGFECAICLLTVPIAMEHSESVLAGPEPFVRFDEAAMLAVGARLVAGWNALASL